MEFKPYYYPPKTAQICQQQDRKKIFEKQYPHVECKFDPYHPERVKIFQEMLSELQQHVNENNNVSQKEVWQKILQKKYEKMHVPYNMFNKFMKKIIYINNNTPANKNAKLLYDYIDYIHETYFLHNDPFYSFYSILDFCIFEFFKNEHICIEDNSSKQIKLNVSDKVLIHLIKKLAENGYIGITQFRFYIYFSILYRPSIFDELILLLPLLETPLSLYIKDNLINFHIYKRLLLEDSLQFAFTNLQYSMVNHLVEDLNVPIESIPENIKNTMCQSNLNMKPNANNTNISFNQKIIKKYYKKC